MALTAQGAQCRQRCPMPAWHLHSKGAPSCLHAEDSPESRGHELQGRVTRLKLALEEEDRRMRPTKHMLELEGRQRDSVRGRETQTGRRIERQGHLGHMFEKEIGAIQRNEHGPSIRTTQGQWHRVA
eukprot:1151168-Pelagomonas_calceolata.AAC.6